MDLGEHVAQFRFPVRDRAGQFTDADPWRTHQRVRTRGLKPLVTCHGQVLEPDRGQAPRPDGAAR
jgi:hypothetical protein